MNAVPLSLAFATVLALPARSSAGQAPVTAATVSENVVQALLNAYNAHDIDAFVAT